MKYFLFHLTFALAFTCFGQAKSAAAKAEVKKAETIKATVKGTSLNVRATANTRSEVLCQLGKDEAVTVFEVKENWARIQAPAASIVWVQSENIKKNLISKPCSIYAGPATLYSVVGKLEIGNKIQVMRGSEKWVQIKAPQGISAWVSADYLQFPGIDVVKNDKADENADSKKAEVKNGATTDEKLNELKDNQKIIATLDPGDKQYYFDKKLAAEKGLRQVTGTVTQLKKKLDNLATHALVIKVDKKFYTICYLRSNNFKLEEWVGKKVAVQGKEELIAGWQYSIIVAETIRPILGTPVLKMKPNTND